jgi:hypothetical protein
MDHNRLFGDGVSLIQPRSTDTAQMMPGAFVVCPWTLQPCFGTPAGWVEDVYRLAYQQARTALLPPWHERILLASFN